jgi:hypothetical protein
MTQINELADYQSDDDIQQSQEQVKTTSKQKRQFLFVKTYNSQQEALDAVKDMKFKIENHHNTTYR